MQIIKIISEQCFKLLPRLIMNRGPPPAEYMLRYRISQAVVLRHHTFLLFKKCFSGIFRQRRPTASIVIKCRLTDVFFTQFGEDAGSIFGQKIGRQKGHDLMCL